MGSKWKLGFPQAKAMATASSAEMTLTSSAQELEFDMLAQSFPSFLVIGPPRTGTSWLHDVLRPHTTLPTSIKETRFFDTHFQRGMKWYRAHFPSTLAGKRSGEVAPTYFASELARERIAKTAPAARIVCIFRHPVERILSLYRIKRAYGFIPWKFEQALVHDPELLESSRYATHLKSWQQTFGTDSVLAAFYEDLRDQPQVFLDRVLDFIAVPQFSLTDDQIKRVHSSETMTHPRSYYRTRSATLIADWCKARRLHHVVAAVKQSALINLFLGGGAPFSELPPSVISNLYELFRPEVEELESMLNRDLSVWKAPEASLEEIAS